MNDAQLDADDALTCKPGVEARGLSTLTSSVRVISGPPLCGPAFSQVALDRQGEVRRSDKPWLKVGSWLSVSTSGIPDCRCLGPREGWGGGSRVLSITVVT
jgi:hypothetical protein